MSNILNQFGKNVAKYRKQQLISQEELASKSGLHRTYISSIEQGNRNISLKNIDKIAQSLNVEISELFIF